MPSRDHRRCCLWRPLFLLLWAALLPGTPALAHDASSWRQAIAEVRPSVVGVGTVLPTRSPPIQLNGTGFAVGDGHHVITNAHVVEQGHPLKEFEYLAVLVGRGARPEIRQARVTATDEAHDLALLEIEGKALPPLTLGDSGSVREGDLLLFTGFPIGLVLGLYPATHHALVAAITPIAEPAGSARELDVERIKRLRDPYVVFQLDATAYPGNSGSPLYDPDTARVLGVINKVFVQESKENVLERPSGISYAIPIRFARDLLQGSEGHAGMPGNSSTN